MRKLFKFLHPKNYSITLQIILFFTLTFLVFSLITYLVIKDASTFILIFLYIPLFIIVTFIINILFSSPIKTYEISLNEIKNLNFDFNIKEISNKNYKQITNSINEINKSFFDIISNLNVKNDEISKYSTEIKKESQYKKQLVATISHEIKTPLMAMQAMVCGVLDGIFTDDEAKKELENVLLEINNINLMLQEIVQIYQLETSEKHFDLQQLDLITIIQESINSCEKIAVKYNQKIIFNFNEHSFIFADYKELLKVINNILLNAIIYSKENNNININITNYKTHDILEIINYGINIPNDELSKVFEPFYRVDKSRNKSEDHGNGLGLYIVSEVLKKHGFDYGIENIINGLKFYIIFPKFKKESN